MNVQYIVVRPCVVGTANWQGYTKTSTGPNQGHKGSQNTGKGLEKHRTLTFRLHQEQDFLIFRLWSARHFLGSLFIKAEALRRQHERATSSQSRSRAANRSRLGQFVWAVASWRSVGAYAVTNVGLTGGGRVQPASCSRPGQFYQLSGIKITQE